MAPRKGIKRIAKATLTNIDELIQISKDKISNLNDQLKTEKATLRKLEKEKIIQDKVVAEQKEKEAVKKLMETMKAAGKTVEDVVALIKK